MFDGMTVEPNSSIYVHPDSTTTNTIIASDEVVDTETVTVQVLPTELINRALCRPGSASDSVRGAPPVRAVDGDTATYWMSGSLENGRWILVNLGKTFLINKVILAGEFRYAKTYYLQFGDSLGNFKNVYVTTSGSGNVDSITAINSLAYFLRVFCNKRNVPDSGYMLKEIEVYSPPLTSVNRKSLALPVEFSLSQNYPNPFNSSTTISFVLQNRCIVKMKVFNLLG